MAEPARTYNPAPTVLESTRPPLEVVRDVPTVHAVESGPPLGEVRAWRMAAIGAAIGFTVAAVAITVIGTLAGIGAGGALGLAVFVAAFGGIGFGFMVGGMAGLARELDAHPAAATTKKQGENR
jgi:hypothetical protein